MTGTPLDLDDPTLAGLLADLREAHAALNRYLDEGRRESEIVPVTGPWPDAADHPDLLPVDAAASRAGVSRDTIRRWCRVDGIGRAYGSRWRVSLSRLRQRLDG